MNSPEADQMMAALERLLVSSLTLWKHHGTVWHETSGAIIVETDRHMVHIIRAAPGIPFRWSITIDERERVAGSVSGLLRMLRSSLDPDFRPSRVRIAPIEFTPP